MLLKIEQRNLTCKLTEKEIADKGQELAGLCQKIGASEDAEATRRKQVKEVIEGLEGNRGSLASIVKSGEEIRLVQVRLDIEGSQVAETRLDTLEIMITRPATKDEMQRRLSWEIESINPVPEKESGGQV